MNKSAGTNPVRLSPEESLEFAKRDGFWEGFAAGVRAASEELRRQRVAEIIAAQKVVEMQKEVV